MEHEHALKILKTLGIEASKIIRVSAEDLPEAIMYLTGGGSARTAWVSRVDGKVTARDEPGFPAFPK